MISKMSSSFPPERKDDERTKMMLQILEASKNGSTKQRMLKEAQDKGVSLSHQQLRNITAELTDRELLRYSEMDGIYITTDKGYQFLKTVGSSDTKT
jgi:predicted transcriptional regulator